MPIKTYDPGKLTHEQNAVVESIIKMAEAEIQPKQKCEHHMWKPAEGDLYFYCDTTGGVTTMIWENDLVDNKRYDYGNCYRTKEEALFVIEQNKVITELRRFAEEHNDAPIIWNGIESNYDIVYNHNSNIDCVIEPGFSRCWQSGNIHFSSREIAESAIRVIGEDRLKKYYFGSYKEQE